MTPSGPDWVAKFPTSHSLTDLVEPFRTKAMRFTSALRVAGATVTVNATLRPPQRAYLMHFSFAVAREALNPAAVPAKNGVDIDWVHKKADGSVDLASSKAAAELMVQGYDIAFKPVLESRHSQGLAIDMDITWNGTLAITIPDGTKKIITSTPRTGAGNTELQAVGKLYGVLKLATDAPHWSSDGH